MNTEISRAKRRQVKPNFVLGGLSIAATFDAQFFPNSLPRIAQGSFKSVLCLPTEKIGQTQFVGFLVSATDDFLVDGPSLLSSQTLD